MSLHNTAAPATIGPHRAAARWSRRLGVPLAILIAAGLASLAVWGAIQGRESAPTSGIREAALNAPSRLATSTSGTPLIEVSDAALQASGIEIATPARGQYRQLLTAY